MTDFLKKCAWWFVAGCGFDVSQRLLDHAIDLATEKYTMLEWLK